MPSSSIAGISSGSGKRIDGESSSFCFLLDRSFNGAASISVLFEGAECPKEGSEKPAKLSLRDSDVGWASLSDDTPGLALENVVNKADCGIDDAVGVDEIGGEYAWKGVFLAGESVVNIGGVGAVIGTKPSLPCPGFEVLISRGAFVGVGLGCFVEGGSKIYSRVVVESFSIGCSGSDEGSSWRECDLGGNSVW